MRCAVALALPLFLLLLTASVRAQDYTYITNAGQITITGYIGAGGAVAIPATITGLPVTAIGNSAFINKASLTSVTIPNSVTSLGDSAFSHCTSLTSVMIPDSVTSMGVFAFNYCTGLTSVTIPDSVTSIGVYAFGSCTSLTSIEVDAANSFYSSADGVLLDKGQTTLIQCPEGKAGSFTIPNSVSSIGYGAFFECTGLTSVTIPNSVISIGDRAFSNCTGLTSVTIGDSVTSLGDGAFSFCTSLMSVMIPNSVINLGDFAFSSCAGLTSVTIGDSVASIGSAVFYDCSSLTSVTIPNSVTNIWNFAFANCTSLTSVYFAGNAPTPVGTSVLEATPATIYYLPGTTGWLSSFAGRPTVLWNPAMPTDHPGFGVQANQFGFTITGPNDLVVVVEACTNLTSPNWSPVSTNTLTGGSSYFSDPQWSNQPTRVYRLRSP